MAYILDIVVILILMLFVWLGYRRGLVRAVITLIGCVLAVWISSMLSPLIASGVFDTFLRDDLQQTVTDQVSGTDAVALEEGIRAVLEDLPKPVQNFLEAYGAGSPAELAASLSGQVDGKTAVADIVMENIVEPVAVTMLTAGIFFLVFMLLMIVVRLIASMINRVFHLPVLRQLNGLGGAVIGVLEGCLMVLVVVTIVQLASYGAGADAWVTSKDIASSHLFSVVAENNPVLPSA